MMMLLMCFCLWFACSCNQVNFVGLHTNWKDFLLRELAIHCPKNDTHITSTRVSDNQICLIVTVEIIRNKEEWWWVIPCWISYLIGEIASIIACKEADAIGSIISSDKIKMSVIVDMSNMYSDGTSCSSGDSRVIDKRTISKTQKTPMLWLSRSSR